MLPEDKAMLTKNCLPLRTRRLLSPGFICLVIIEKMCERSERHLLSEEEVRQSAGHMIWHTAPKRRMGT